MSISRAASDLRSSSVTGVDSSVSRVPPEIWIQIFEWASFLPGLMDIGVPNPLQPSAVKEWYSPFTWNNLRACLATRRAIVLVCQRWYTVGLPILYHCLFIRDSACRISLQRTFAAEAAARKHSAPSVPLWSWARHLVLDVDHLSSNAEFTSEMEAVSAILFFVPNLKILSFGAIGELGQLPKKFTDTLSKTCGSTLRRIYLRWNQFPFLTSAQCDHLLASLPNLETIVGGSFMGRCVAAMPRLPNLHHITLFSEDCGTSHDSNVNFPAVREASLRIGVHAGWKHFTAVHGPLLTTIYLTYMSPLGPDSIQRDLNVLKDDCPNLTHLIIHLVGWSQIFPMVLPPSVTHLGLSFNSMDRKFVIRPGYGDLFAGIASIKAPSLKVVRLLSGAPNQYLRFVDFPALSKCGFHLEDATGTRLTPHRALWHGSTVVDVPGA